MTKSMTDVLSEHYIDITETNLDNIGRCVCGHTADSMNIGWDDHLAEALSAAGYGPVADAKREAWDEGKDAVWTFMSNQDPRRERPTNPYREASNDDQ